MSVKPILKPLTLVLFAATLAFSLSGNSGYANEADPVQYFSEFDENSEVTINHEPLDGVLRDSVLPFGRAAKRLGPKGKTTQASGSNLRSSINSLPSRYEGNRVMIHAFSDDHREFFLGYQQGLEALSNRRPLKDLSKDEQLAFWLNLYNVAVMNKLIDEYPIKSLKKLRRDSNSFWQQKVTVIEGIPLSLTDIEDILTANWDSPLVIYGLWQGSIGGPSLRNQAYNGKNVWALLEKNAVEFVNSNRGVIPKKDTLEVSEFYGWLNAAFDRSDATLLAHIKSYADPNFMGDIGNFTKISYDYYDWLIADLIGGTLWSGNQYAVGIRDEFKLSEVPESNALAALPPQARELFIEMFKEDAAPEALRGVLTPVITTEECAPEESCRPGE